MKNIKLLAIFMLFGVSEFTYTNVVLTSGSTIPVINNSDMPIKVEVIYSDTALNYTPTTAIAAGSQVGKIPYRTGTLTIIKINYLDAAGNVKESLSFSPTAIAKALYVYGAGSTPITELTKVGVVPNLIDYPARYVGWWTGNIDTTKFTQATDDAKIAAAKVDADVAKLVTMYMISTDGKNTLVTF